MGRDFRPRTEDREERFAHVFTKLQGLGLTDYEKVLMMDIDLLVRDSIVWVAGGNRYVYIYMYRNTYRDMKYKCKDVFLGGEMLWFCDCHLAWYLILTDD